MIYNMDLIRLMSVFRCQLLVLRRFVLHYVSSKCFDSLNSMASAASYVTYVALSIWAPDWVITVPTHVECWWI